MPKAGGLLHSSPTRRTHRPIPIHSFRQSYEAKSAHAHQAFFQEFEVRPALPSASGEGGPWGTQAGGDLPPCLPSAPLPSPVVGGDGSASASSACPASLQELKEVGREQPRLEAEHPANTTKNRYPHVLPCECRGRLGAWHRQGEEAACARALNKQLVPSADDHSRVRLTPLEGEPHSDYINANFIPVRATCGAIVGASGWDMGCFAGFIVLP